MDRQSGRPPMEQNVCCQGHTVAPRHNPLHFEGRNSRSFYLSALIRKALGIKANIEMLHLPREVFKSRRRHYTITVGERIPWQSLAGGTEAAATASRLRDLTYSISDHSSHV